MTKRYEMTVRHNDGSISITHTDALSHVKATVDIYRDSKVEFDVKDHAAASSQITDKWVAILGIGFNPDTRGDEYNAPALSAALVAEYERDMQTLNGVSQDAYAECIAAFERAGLIVARRILA